MAVEELRSAGRMRVHAVGPVIIALFVAALLALTAAPAGAASTVSVDAGVMLVAAAPGEANRVQVKPSGAGYLVADASAGATAGPGCEPVLEFGYTAACAGVQKIVVQLGDGDDSAAWLDPAPTSIAVEVYGEAGRDQLDMYSGPGTLSDGGEGDDRLLGSVETGRGGPGNDTVVATKLLEGGDGNDVLIKTDAPGAAPGKLDGGPGDDRLQAKDGNVDELTCGDGKDLVFNKDPGEQPDATCESGAGTVAVLKPAVTVFELPNVSAKPGKDGRLPVWMKCSVPACAVTVRITGYVDPQSLVRRFRRRDVPLLSLVVGTQAKLYRLRLSRVQRRILKRSTAGDLIRAVVVASGQTGRSTLITDGIFCSRKSPCRGGR